MARWCTEVSGLTGKTWRYLKVPQGRFALFLKVGDVHRFEALVDWLCAGSGDGPLSPCWR
jgi:hypothetical protein